jgi:ornithine cyclodeaminase/alanine dehydrogenase-like protein (mu-crystallin family)
MVELHPEILKQAVAPQHDHRHFHKHARQSGAVLVDSVEACLKEAGEVIQAGLQPEEVVELGELVMLKKENERRKAEMGEKGKGGMEIKGDGGLIDWLSKGNVIYKSVGLGLMDVVTGTEIVRLADERSVGTRILGF